MKHLNPLCYLSGHFGTKKVWPLFAFQIEKAKMLSSAQEQLLPHAVLNATYFPKGISKVSQGQTWQNLVYVSEQIHARFTEYFICRLCSGTSVATCWWSLTDGCSLFFYMAVRSHTSHLFHIVAGSQHGSKDCSGESLQEFGIKLGCF